MIVCLSDILVFSDGQHLNPINTSNYDVFLQTDGICSIQDGASCPESTILYDRAFSMIDCNATHQNVSVS